MQYVYMKDNTSTENTMVRNRELDETRRRRADEIAVRVFHSIKHTYGLGFRFGLG